MSRGFVVKGGKTLPELTSPASASDIWSGKQAIDQDGEVITGTKSGTVLQSATITVHNISGQDSANINGTTIADGRTGTLSLYVGLRYGIAWMNFNGRPSVSRVSGASVSSGKLGYNSGYISISGTCEVNLTW